MQRRKAMRQEVRTRLASRECLFYGVGLFISVDALQLICVLAHLRGIPLANHRQEITEDRIGRARFAEGDAYTPGRC